MPKVSVIMPVFNGQTYIDYAINSILGQTFTDFELLIINDGSTDKTEDIIKNIRDDRIQYYCFETNKGVAYARNFGIELARGKYIALMDSDDIAPDYRLEKQVDYLEKHIDCDCIVGRMKYIDEQNMILPKYHQPYYNSKYIKARLIFSNAIANGTAMFKKDLCIRHNIKYKNYNYAEDYAFWIDYSLVGKISGVDEVFQLYRIRGNGLTATSAKEKKNEILDEIHTEVLRQYGFQLNDSELKVYLVGIREQVDLHTNEEILIFYRVLLKMIKQAENILPDAVNEFRNVSKKIFAEIIEKSDFIWNM